VTARRLVTAVLLVVLLGAAGAALWRSAAPRPDSTRSIAAQLVCPACQGETVAQSSSPMAAAMRDTITAQLAAGRSPDEIRQWFVDRYGATILADPPQGGLGVVLWVVPVLAVAVLLTVVWRARRRRETPLADDPGAAPPVRRPARLWDAVAVAVVAMVAVIAFTSPHEQDPEPARAAEPASTLVSLGRSLESQGRYAEAAEVYRDAASQTPVDEIRLRLAFALLRSDHPAEAADTAEQILGHAPGDTQALLLLGLAQRATGSPEAPATLRRFLRAAPSDPAAAEVRRLLSK
jgi:cytochrome c-type biogenesis protein CcmH/NrfF